MFERQKQTLRKERAKITKIEQTKKHNIFQKGVDGQKGKKKWNFEREDKRKKG